MKRALTPDGRLLGRRVLLHPHETEQPGTSEVVVRARHKPRGYDGTTKRVPLPR